MTDIFPPHSGQNFGEPSGWWPQPVQVSLGGAVGVPHSGQNFALPTSTPHAAQFAAAAAARGERSSVFISTRRATPTSRASPAREPTSARTSNAG